MSKNTMFVTGIASLGARGWRQLARRLGARRASPVAATGAVQDLVVENRGNEGPPDLEELWRDFNRRLSNLFSGRGGSSGGGEGPGPSDMRGAGVGIGLVLGLVLLIWFGSGFFIVTEGQKAVVMSFGRFSHIAEAGFQWRMPYPFQSHEIVNFTGLRSAEIGTTVISQATGLRDSSMLTQDQNIVDIRFTVQYRLKDARAFVFENADPVSAVTKAGESAVREIVGRSDMNAVLYEQRDALAIDLVKLIQLQLDRLKAGILIVNVNVSSVQPPEQVQSAFEEAVKASTDRTRFKKEGETYAREVINKAGGTAARLKEEATGYAAQVVAQAEGDSDRFRRVLEEYKKAPGVTRDRLYIDTMREVYSNATKVMVDSRSGSNLLYLPLDKIVQQVQSSAIQSVQQAQPVASGGSTIDVTPTTPTITDVRARDTARTRDREGR